MVSDLEAASGLVQVFGNVTEEYTQQFAVFGKETDENGEYLYRYVLSRTWDPTLPKMVTILLNPSVADQNHSDPTNTRGEVRAREYGYGSNVFLNLFAFRSPHPTIMKAHPSPVGCYNDCLLYTSPSPRD